MLTVVLFASSVLAQHRLGTPGGFSPGFKGSSFRASGRHSTAILGGTHRRFDRYSPGFYGYYDGFPYYSDYYGPSEPEYPPQEAPAPQAPAPQVKSEPLPDPVLLELRGSQWVRVTNFGESTERSLQGGTAGEPQTSAKLPETPAAILVFRDGHTEEVNSYSIIGEKIYTKSDYWSTGAWTLTIPIADLDIAATLKQNQQRGVKFDLPSGPDEVMIRP